MLDDLVQVVRRLKGSHNPLWRAVRADVLSFFLWAAVALLACLSRVRVVGGSNVQRVITEGGILCCWHSKTLFLVHLLQKRGVLAVISRSRDGEIQARAFERFGFELIRGSSGGGGGGVAAIRSAARAVRRGRAMGITPDGPRGPRERVQQGVAAIASLCGHGVVPIGVGCSNARRLSTWDRYMVPKPGSRVVILCGDPVLPGEGPEGRDVEQLRLRIERAIEATEAEAQRLAEIDGAR